MKKRMLSFLLALCLIVGMLPVIALAEETTEPVEKTATLTINTGTASDKLAWTPTMSAGMTPAYAKNDDNGYVTKSSASDWTIKVEWPAEGNPTMTLKNATITNNIKATTSYAINMSGTADWTILLAGENKIFGNPTSSTKAWEGGQTIRATNAGSLTIQNLEKDASLLIENKMAHNIYKTKGALTFKDANISLRALNIQYQYHCIFMDYATAGYEDATNVTIDGGNVSFYVAGNSGSAIVVGATVTSGSSTYARRTEENTSDIVIENGADVRINRGTAGYNTYYDTAIDFGSGATLSIKNSDVDIYCVNKTFARAPYLTGHSSVKGAAWSYGTYNLTEGQKVESTFSCFRVTHTCVAGEPETEFKIGTMCEKEAFSVTKCIYCEKVMSSTEIALETPEKIHTPGKKVELVDQRVDAGTETYTDAENVEQIRVKSGKYVFQCTCAVCGETWTEEETFQPAILDYLPLASEGTKSQTKDYSKRWGDQTTSTYAPRVVISAGQTRYFTTEGGHATFTENRYVTPVIDEAKIAAGDWSIKLEYPLYGDPIMTLKNAEIINNFGLWYGIYNYTDLAPLTVIVDGTNVLSNSGTSTATDYTIAGVLNFRTNSPVTIVGRNNGKLYIDARTAKATTIRSLGDLTFNDLAIELKQLTDSSNNQSYSNRLIESQESNTTINNCDIDINATAPMARICIRYGIGAPKGTLSVNNSDIFALANVQGTKYGILHAKDIVISESKLQLACAYLTAATATRYGDAVYYTNSARFIYANGFVAHDADTKTHYIPENTPAWSPPASLKTYTTVAKLTSTVLNHYYFDITPNANPTTPDSNALTKFDGTAVTVENDLTLEFALDPTNIPEGSIAYVSRVKNNKTETREIPLTDAILEKGYYVIPYTGIAAKEMHDEITVVVKTADGKQITEKKTDSVYDYIVRMLASEQGDMSDAKYEALKTILVDMLNYGTMAQVRFDYNTTTLANAALTPTHWEKYASPTETYEAIKAETTGTGYIGTAFELKSSIAMLMGIDTTELGKGSYAMVYMEGATEGVRVEAEDLENNLAVYTFNGLKATNGNTNVTWKFYTADAAEDAEPILTVTDSLAGYVGRNVQKYPYLADLMKYCDSAAAYFNA